MAKAMLPAGTPAAPALLQLSFASAAPRVAADTLLRQMLLCYWYARRLCSFFMRFLRQFSLLRRSFVISSPDFLRRMPR